MAATLAPPRTDLQNVDKARGLTPQQALQKLKDMKRGARAAYWPNLAPILVDDASRAPSRKRAKLQCLQCGDTLEPTNPANLGKSHFNESGSCKKHASAAAIAPAAGDEQLASTSGAGPSNPGTDAAKKRKSLTGTLLVVPPVLQGCR
jgi:hypothetical protein